ncbi:MAG TPA: cupredoxin family copper-binding protein [Pantanalinema sp.]
MRRLGPVLVLVMGLAGSCAPSGGGGGPPIRSPGPSPTAQAGTEQPSSDSVTVTVRDFAFRPASVEIPRGGTVTWRFEDATAHNAKSTADSAFAWDSGLHRSEQTFSQRFDTAGTFPYVCTPHPFMRGTVTVR